MNTKPLLTNLFYFIVAGFVFSSCEDPKSHGIAEASDGVCLDETFMANMEIVIPEKKIVKEGISLTGSVESNPDKVINFVSLADGIISNTYFSLGDHVKQGQLLADLRSAELSGLFAQSKTIESQIKVAEKKLQSAQSMFDDEISSQKDLMEVQSDLEILKAEQEKINANLSLFSASAEKGVFQIKAPNTGIITSKSISSGTQISAGGDALFTISDLSEVWVMLNIYASNVQNITTNMEVEIKTLSYPGEDFKGEISAISQVLDLGAKVLKARVVLPNNQLKLKPGMLVDVMGYKQSNDELLSIPTSAMVFSNNRNFVVIYNDACDLEVREIDIHTKSNGITFISSGLNVDEKIISKNQLLVFEQIKNFQN